MPEVEEAVLPMRREIVQLTEVEEAVLPMRREIIK